jgi:hypothetical protein
MKEPMVLYFDFFKLNLFSYVRIKKCFIEKLGMKLAFAYLTMHVPYTMLIILLN